MTSARKTMKKKARFKAEIDRLFPKDLSDALWQEATNRLAALQKQYASLPKGVRFHTNNKILPAAAIYLTLKERIGQSEAYQIMEGATFKTADAAAKVLAAVLRIPGRQSLFVKAWDPLALGAENVSFVQGDVGALPFEGESFDIVLSLNGFHAFPDKDAAYRETFRVLKPDGVFCGCFYIAGEFKRTDFFIQRFYVPKGFFTPPFETRQSLTGRLKNMYSRVNVHAIKAEGIFCCVK